MKPVFDYNGTFVSPSKPVRNLQTVKKTLHIDSADRDTVKFTKNGDFVVSLPRVYENVVSLRLSAAQFPPLSGTLAGALTHSYASGPNTPSGVFSSDSTVGSLNYYFFIDIEGLNKADESALAANKSAYPDGLFAKIPAAIAMRSDAAPAVYFIEYNDHTNQENIARYTPAIGKLDRLHIRTRLHSQQGNQGFIYWTTTGAYDGSDANFSLTLEIEYLDNVFNDFSSFETRLLNHS